MTPGRRVSDTRKKPSPFAAGFSVPKAAPAPAGESAADEPLAEPAAPEQRPAAEAKPKKPPTVKFTASLDYETAESFDRLASLARRKLYRQVDKLDVLKALIRLASDDVSLRDQVIDEVGKS